MEKKYLPIGSICTLKGKNKKYMITGYYSIDFNGNLLIKDYSGCVYPEGYLLPNQIINFNHSDIQKIDFMGYKNEQYDKFLGLLNRLNGDTTNNSLKNNKKGETILTSSSSYQKLLFDENGVVIVAEPVKEEKTDIKFDSNGVVISVNDKKTFDNPFHKDFTNENIKSQTEPSKWDIFDENISDKSLKNDVEKTNYNEKLSKIEFDENGTVISVGKEELENSAKYKFDENGTLISVDE